MNDFTLLLCLVLGVIVLTNYWSELMAKLNELAAQLVALNDQVNKARTEVLAKLLDLEAQLSNVDLPAEAQAALDALKASVQAVDDVVPDAPAASATIPVPADAAAPAPEA
jgi:chromosome segregation ATPase